MEQRGGERRDGGKFQALPRVLAVAAVAAIRDASSKEPNPLLPKALRLSRLACGQLLDPTNVLMATGFRS